MVAKTFKNELLLLAYVVAAVLVFRLLARPVLVFYKVCRSSHGDMDVFFCSKHGNTHMV